MQLKCIINSEPDEELSFIAKRETKSFSCSVTSLHLSISFSMAHHMIQFLHKTDACFILLSSLNVWCRLFGFIFC